MSYAQTTSHLRFDDKSNADLHQKTLLASLGLNFGGGWSMAVAAGAVLTGDMLNVGRRWNVEPGWTVGVSGNKRWLDADGGVPFIHTAVTLAAVGMHTSERGGDARGSLIALDFRIGLTVGWTLWDVWSPYLAVRTFGGPAHWDRDGDSRSGTDRFHFVAAVGSTIALPGGVLIFGEYIPIFESGFSAGVGVGF